MNQPREVISRRRRRTTAGLGALLPLACLLAAVMAPARVAAQTSGGLSLAPKDISEQEASMAYRDPLAPMNEEFFKFNMALDRWVTRPIATGWNRVAPTPVRKALARFFDNVNVIPRFANNLFQLKLLFASEEAARFLINTTVGVAGFFDPADAWFGLKEHPQDFGLTLGYYGVGMGPYLMVPIFGPFDLRDGFGYVVDGAMNPIDYFLSIVQVVYVFSGVIAVRSVNYESLHLDLFEDADRYSVDLYGAVQDAYLQHRERLLREALHPELRHDENQQLAPASQDSKTSAQNGSSLHAPTHDTNF